MRGSIGVGELLRRARTARGLTLDDVARDLRIRAEVLSALEAETFESIRNQTYVRGSLRSYATYLGLPAAGVVEWYRRHVSREEEEQVSPLASVEMRRRRDDSRFVGLIAGAILLAAAGLGILSADGAAPAPIAPLSTASPRPVGEGEIVLAVTASAPVRISIQVDGGPVTSFDLRAGEGRSFGADVEIGISVLDPLAIAAVTVNGLTVDLSGVGTEPWSQTFRSGAVAVATAPEPGEGEAA